LPCAQRCRIFANRLDCRPHCYDRLRGLSPGYRHDRAWRTADATCAAHDRLPKDVRGELQHLPRVRGGDPRRLSRDGSIRPHPTAYLRGRRMTPGPGEVKQVRENEAQAEATGDVRAVIVRPSRETDVEAMLA